MIKPCSNCGLELSNNIKFCSNCGFENKILEPESSSDYKSKINSPFSFLHLKKRHNIALLISVVNIITLIIFAFYPRIFVWGGKHFVNYNYNFILIGSSIVLNIIALLAYWRTGIVNLVTIFYFIVFMISPNNFHYSYYDNQFNIQKESHIYTLIIIAVTLIILLKYSKYEKKKN